MEKMYLLLPAPVSRDLKCVFLEMGHTSISRRHLECDWEGETRPRRGGGVKYSGNPPARNVVCVCTYTYAAAAEVRAKAVKMGKFLASPRAKRRRRHSREGGEEDKFVPRSKSFWVERWRWGLYILYARSFARPLPPFTLGYRARRGGEGGLQDKKSLLLPSAEMMGYGVETGVSPEFLEETHERPVS